MRRRSVGWPTSRQVKRAGVHVRAGQQAQLLELLGVEEVGLVDHQHHPLAPLGLLGGQGIGGLRDEGGLVEPGHAAQARDDGVVETPGARRRGCRSRGR